MQDASGNLIVGTFDASTRTFVDATSIRAQEEIPTDMAFSSDGAKMFVIGDAGDDVNEYDLSVPFDASTRSFVDATSISLQETNPQGMAFSSDGAKMFVIGTSGGDVNEYTLSTAFDASTRSFVDATPISEQETAPTGIAFSNDGTKMFIVDFIGVTVNEYDLSVPFDASTRSFVDATSISLQETTPTGIAFSNDGTKMFIVGDVNDNVNEYTLSTPFDASTLTFVDATRIRAQETFPTGIAFSNDGAKMFVIGDAGDDVNEYDLHSVYPIRVPDTTPPVITLTGDDTVTITVGTPYTDAGAACTDDADGSITPTPTGTVDTSQAGEYTVTYSCTDAAGNDAAQVSRTVTVQDAPDTTPPVITLTGDDTVTITVGTPYTDAGAACTDDADGPITPTPTGTVDTGQAGEYTVTYSCTDAAGNDAAQVSRTVIVQEAPDTTPPTFVSSGLNSTAGVLTITFSETIDAANIVPAKMHIRESGNYTHGTTLTAGELDTDADGATVSFTLTPSHRAAVAGLAAPELTIEPGAVRDESGNLIVGTFDASTRTFVDATSIRAQEGNPRDIAFSSDGTKMFVIGVAGDDVNEYALSAPFDASTRMFVDATSISEQENSPQGMAFSSDGAKMFVIGDTGDAVNEYDLSSPFDASTMSFVDATSIRAQERNPQGMAFSSDGAKMFVIGNTGDDVNEYDLSAPFDASTRTFVDATSIRAQENNPQGMVFSSDGTKMFIVGSDGDAVNEYDLSAPFDASTMSFVDATRIQAQEGTPHGMAFSSDGTKMFIVGSEGDAVNEYDLHSVYPIRVPDTTPPVITLTGDDTVTITVGTPYADEGATCTDDADGPITPTPTGTVDTGQAGEYTVTYSCTDAAGNHAAQVSRTVIVQEAADTTPPVITLTGDDTVTITVGTPYTDAGAACTDDADGPITPTPTGTVDTSQAGEYTVTYSCTDAAGNDAAPVSRTVNVEAAPDTTPPVITLTGDAAVTITVGDAYNEQGAVCDDDVDPDKAATVGGDTVDTGTAATYAVTYDCTDSSNNAATQVTRTVIVRETADTTPPTFVSSGLNSTAGVLTITFSEEIDATPATKVDPAKIHLRESGTYTGGVTLTSGELDTDADGATISFTLTAPHLAAVAGLATPELTIEPGAVQDASGNLIVGTFDASTRMFVDATSIRAQEDIPTDMAFSSDGTKMFVIGTIGYDVNEYDLSTPFDASTRSFVDATSIQGQETSPRGMAFSSDGAKMFVIGLDGVDVNEYTLSTAFDASTRSFVDATPISEQETAPTGIAFSNDGTKMFIVDFTGVTVSEYDLSVPFDASTLSFVDATSISEQETAPTGIAFSNDGAKMFVIGGTGDDVNEYDLSAPFDASTLTFVDATSIRAQETFPTGIAFSSDGAKMFIVGTARDRVIEYDLHSVYPITVTGTYTVLPAGAFVTTWNATSSPHTISIPLEVRSGGTITINWGDGSTADVTANGTQSRAYSGPGDYRVSMAGDLSRINLGATGATASKLASIDQWGDVEWSSMKGAFQYATGMTYGATDSPDLSGVSSMKEMFNFASKFDGDISGWNVSGVADMKSMFDNASSFNGDISGWNVSGVTDMGSMFANAFSFNRSLNSWNVSGVADMDSMFFAATSFDQPLNSWDVSSVTDMGYMFGDATSFDQPLNSWDVSGVADMGSMFDGASAFNQPLNSWNVSSVTDMGSMFDGATSFDQNLGEWYVVLDDDAISDSAETLGIRAQNTFLDGQGPTYGLGTGGDSDKFVISGGSLGIKPAEDYFGETQYRVNVTSTGGFGTDNHHTVDVMVQEGVTTNNVPVANAGPDQTVPEGSTVNLDGTATDPDSADTLTYSWSHNSTALTITLANSAALDTSFAAPNVSEDTPVEFTLEVSDGTATVTDKVTVTITDSANTAPTVDAGGDQTVPEGSTVNLDGTATDPDSEDTLTYSWSHSSALSITLDDDSALDTSFAAPNVSEDTPVEFTLEVSDGTDTVTDKVTVTITDSANTAPTVDAGGDQTVPEGSTVNLDGTATDPDSEDTLTYSWSHSSALSITLDDDSALDTSFAAPNVSEDTPVEFTLEVSDGTDTVTDKVTVTITDDSHDTGQHQHRPDSRRRGPTRPSPRAPP